MHKFVACILFALSFTLYANVSGAQESIDDLSKRLASINQKLIDLNQSQFLANATVCSNMNIHTRSAMDHVSNQSPVANIYNVAINEMHELKLKYDKNPYIKIIGFDINLALIPSVTVKIDFKK
ncbi:MAG: hypothetical protein M3R00_03280 [Pseudomonadota bacterium]|nr:hypothetical protein [Pseudomonadota bacterium]